jgi:hypothetical protein
MALNVVDSGLPNFALAGSRLLSGVSNTRAFANVIEKLQEVGLPTDDNADGSANLMNLAFFCLIQGSNDEWFENDKVEVFIPPLVMTPAGFTSPTKAYGKAY